MCPCCLLIAKYNGMTILQFWKYWYLKWLKKCLCFCAYPIFKGYIFKRIWVKLNSCAAIRMSSEGSKKIPEPRVVSVKKAQVELGVQICGGNLRGIFVERLEEDSLVRGPDVLMPGDMILEVSAHVIITMLFRNVCYLIDSTGHVQKLDRTGFGRRCVFVLWEWKYSNFLMIKTKLYLHGLKIVYM